jgi:aldehyde dehydrogenase
MDEFVNGEFLLEGGVGATTGLVEVRNPADTSEVVGTYPVLEVHHVDQAVEAAWKAQPTWAARPAVERAAVLGDAWADIEAIDDLDRLLVREQGKLLWEASFEIGFYEMLPATFSEYAERLDAGELVVDDGMGRIVCYPEPFGVVGAITPWNFPWAISAVKVVSALLTGNAVVLVVSPSTPFTCLAGYGALARHLPAGLLSVITGPGPKIGQRLVEHPDVPKISFTGSISTGRAVARAAAEQVKSVTLELGGNDPAVLLDDCPIDDKLFGELVGATFLGSGQVCLNIKRVYAPAAKVDEVAEGIAAILDDFVIGSGLDPESSMAPLHNRAQRDWVIGLVDDARRQGATVRECGELRGDPERGWYLRPSIVTGIGQDARLVREEQFGPALPIVGYDNLDQAIDWANDTEFGLYSSIWTADEERAWPLARRFRNGATFFNNHGFFAVDPRAPMGGVKASGVGRELGLQGLLDMTEIHTVSTRHL